MKKTILHFFTLILACCLAFQSSWAQSLPQQNYIRIDQFGYLPTAKKVAVIAKPYSGFNSTEAGVLPHNPSTVKVQLLNATTNTLAYEALPTQWLNGTSADDTRSGDRGYWFDFSSYQTPGTYFIRVYTSATAYIDSYQFKINDNVYVDVLKRAMNMYYYQRSNFNKVTPASNTTGFAAGKAWEDGPWYDNANQQDAVEFKNGGSPKFIKGGWIDAGDPNRYVGFAGEAVHDLLSCYGQFKPMWDQLNLNIPESNNNAPDILDEIKYEIDWLKTMQNYDYGTKAGSGGVLNKVGILRDPGFVSPTSNDNRALKYEQECYHSSVMAAGMFAHAALRYNQHGSTVLTVDVPELTERAEKAWTHYVNTPDKTQGCDNGDIEAGDGDGPGEQYVSEHVAEAVTSAVYLYALTGKAVYNNYVIANYTTTRPWISGGGEWGVYRSQQSDAMLYYASLANGDATVKTAIINKKKDKANATDNKNPYKLVPSTGLYRANSYYDNWGTNVLMSRLGSNNMDYVTMGLETDQTADFKEKAQGFLSFIHGTNPQGMCFLTNMEPYGADFSVKQIHHTWFYTDTQYDNQTNTDIGPAPGYLVSGYNGVNQPSCMKVLVGRQNYNVLVKDQPLLKKFSEKINNEGVDGWRCNSTSFENTNQPWLYTEPGIYFQSAYIRLLAHFVGNVTPQAPVAVTGVSMSPTATSMQAGLSNVVLTAATVPTNATNNAITWTSSNTAVATVSSTGRITSLTAGTSTITATTTDGNFTATCALTVTAAGATTTCSLLTNPGFENNFLHWKNPEALATITSAARTGSKAAEFAGVGGIERNSFINVVDTRDFTYTAYAKVEGSPGNMFIGIDYWNASSKISNDIITVNTTSSTYTLYQLKKTPPAGTTKVLLWLFKNGAGKLFIDDVCFSQDPIAVSSVSVSPTATSLYIGGNTTTLTATVLPSNAEVQTLTWSSSNTSVATVSTTGLVTSVAAGTATIRATSTNGFSGTCTVTVLANTTCGLVINNGFENNFNQWTNKNNSCSIVTSQKRSGAKAVALNTNGAGLENTSLYDVTNGNILTLSAYGYTTNTPTAAMIGIDYLAANGTTELGKDVINIAAAAYTQYGISKLPPAGTVKVRVWAYKGNNGVLYLDDFCLTQRANTCGLLTNNGFEADRTNWTPSTTATAVVTTQKRTDAKAMSITGNNAGIEYSSLITIPAGHTITFEAYGYVSGSPSTAQIGIDYKNNDGSVEYGEDVFNVTATSYTKYGVTAKVPPANTTKAKIWAYKGNNGTLFLDDFCIRTQAASARLSAELKENTNEVVYPNPVYNELSIRTYGTNEALEFSLVDSKGVTVLSTNFAIVQAKDVVKVNVSKTQNGVYFVKVKQGSKSSVSKILKQ
jgi:endoglucanase